MKSKPKPEPKKSLPEQKARVERILKAQNLLTPWSEYREIFCELNDNLGFGLLEVEIDKFCVELELQNTQQSFGSAVSKFIGMRIGLGKTPQDEFDLSVKCLFYVAKKILGYNCVSILGSSVVMQNNHCSFVDQGSINFVNLDLHVGPLNELDSMEDSPEWAGMAAIWWLVFNILVCKRVGFGIKNKISTGIAIQGIVVSEHYIPYVFCNDKEKTLFLTMIVPKDSMQVVLSLSTKK